MEKIVIFGSTGMTGICVVEAALKKGLNVRAFVRDPAKLPANLRKKVEVVKGDVLEYKDVLNAVRNVSGVIVVLGTRNDLRPTTVMSEGMKNIVNAMKELNVEIVSLCLSVYMLVEPKKVPQWVQNINEDHQRMYDAVKSSGLKYIACCPPDIISQRGAGYQINESVTPSQTISKYDLAEFFVDCLTQSDCYGKLVGVCSKRP